MHLQNSERLKVITGQISGWTLQIKELLKVLKHLIRKPSLFEGKVWAVIATKELKAIFDIEGRSMCVGVHTCASTRLFVCSSADLIPVESMLFFAISCPNVMFNHQHMAVMQSLFCFHPLGPQQLTPINPVNCWGVAQATKSMCSIFHIKHIIRKSHLHKCTHTQHH